QTSLEDAVRAVEDTNTSIYSFGFSTMQAAVKHEASKLPAPGGTPYSNEPYSPGGCMSHDPNADRDAHGKRSVQALDCASDLLPPLRLARIAFLAAKTGLKSNVPNYYVLSFRPQSPDPGPHTLELRVKDRPEYKLRARQGYWVDAAADANDK